MWMRLVMKKRWRMMARRKTKKKRCRIFGNNYLALVDEHCSFSFLISPDGERSI